MRRVHGDAGRTAQIDEVLSSDPTPEQDIQDIFERLHGVTVNEVVQDEMEQARADMAAVLDGMGLDMEVPELRADMSEEEVLAATARMADGMRQREEQRIGQRPNRRKTKREAREEERRRRVEQMRKVSVGASYRRLAKALHPDLEQDPVVRERKNAVMQELTTAYARNDVHTLRRLEREWLAGEQMAAGAQPDETLDAYRQLLKEQASALELEHMTLPLQPRYQVLVADDGQFGMPVLIDGPAEVQRLDIAIEGIRAALARMASGKAWQEARALLQAQRAAKRPRRRH